MVVEQATGLPAPDLAAVSRDEIPREQERVWAFDWYGVFPPTLEELAETERTTNGCRRLNVKLLFLVVLLLALGGCQGSGRFETSPIGPSTISNGTSEAAN